MKKNEKNVKTSILGVWDRGVIMVFIRGKCVFFSPEIFFEKIEKNKEKQVVSRLATVFSQEHCQNTVFNRQGGQLFLPKLLKINFQ